MSCTRQLQLIKQPQINLASFIDLELIRRLSIQSFVLDISRTGLLQNLDRSELKMYVRYPELGYSLLQTKGYQPDRIFANILSALDSTTDRDKHVSNIQSLLNITQNSDVTILSDLGGSIMNNWNHIDTILAYLLLVSRIVRSSMSIIQQTLIYYFKFGDIPLITNPRMKNDRDKFLGYVSLLGSDNNFDSYQLLRFYPTINRSKLIWGARSKQYINNTNHGILALTNNLIVPISESNKMLSGNYNQNHSFEIAVKIDDLCHLKYYSLELLSLINKDNNSYKGLNLLNPIINCVTQLFILIDKQTLKLDNQIMLSPTSQQIIGPDISSIMSGYLKGEFKRNPDLLGLLTSNASTDIKYNAALQYFKSIGIRTPDNIMPFITSFITSSGFNGDNNDNPYTDNRRNNIDIVEQIGQLLGFGRSATDIKFNADFLMGLLEERNALNDQYNQSTQEIKRQLLDQRIITMLERSIYLMVILQYATNKNKFTSTNLEAFATLFMRLYYSYGFISDIFDRTRPIVGNRDQRHNEFSQYHPSNLEKHYTIAIFGMFYQYNVNLERDFFPHSIPRTVSNICLPSYVNELWIAIPSGLLNSYSKDMISFGELDSYYQVRIKGLIDFLELELTMQNEGRYYNHQKMLTKIYGIFTSLLLGKD